MSIARGSTPMMRGAFCLLMACLAMPSPSFGQEPAKENASSEAQFKPGVRYESKYVVAALSYGDGLQGNEGGGFEIGIMVFTIPWS